MPINTSGDHRTPNQTWTQVKLHSERSPINMVTQRDDFSLCMESLEKETAIFEEDEVIRSISALEHTFVRNGLKWLKHNQDNEQFLRTRSSDSCSSSTSPTRRGSAHTMDLTTSDSAQSSQACSAGVKHEATQVLKASKTKAAKLAATVAAV
eukprot:315764-Rhodomonas_salina.1